jgi:hypothetical protein
LIASQLKLAQIEGFRRFSAESQKKQYRSPSGTQLFNLGLELSLHLHSSSSLTLLVLAHTFRPRPHSSSPALLALAHASRPRPHFSSSPTLFVLAHTRPRPHSSPSPTLFVLAHTPRPRPHSSSSPTLLVLAHTPRSRPYFSSSSTLLVHAQRRVSFSSRIRRPSPVRQWTSSPHPINNSGAWQTSRHLTSLIQHGSELGYPFCFLERISLHLYYGHSSI